MKNTNNHREVTPTAEEIAALAKIMSEEIKRMISKGMSKNQIVSTLKMYQHDLSQKAFRATK